ncbi:sodium:proton antiporter [Lentilactobacillus curieae]|uniref:Sodium:proton antiporter n=1 Tax=Lentilactobacillus curieae TaxID=1138822 RepID=A0A1S6QJU2_9LACO|nr:cation:proton antiporter [Lentilactobacillus curieae]AQW21875.1 sodium:proton antiporter [Lentilactobacillus curieae]
MHILEAIILLIGIVLFSNVVDHFIPSIPVSLIQVTFGLCAALFLQVSIPLKTDWFLLLFIAPLLFNDGRRFPKRELWKMRGPILGNAIILVFLTTLLGGLLFHVIIPTMPISVSFALAAILSPTDPVAVQSISKRVALPEGVLHIVSGESLINDASGLIAFKYAVAATVTGVFSFKAATLDFFYISIVGFVSGAILITLVILLQNWLFKQGINDVIFNTILQVLTPFGIYLITEEAFHASGVIAVVAGGVLFHFFGGVTDYSQPELTLVSEKTWDIIIYMLNGIVFVILGIELPIATNQIIQNDKINTIHAIFISFIAWLILLVIRVVWIYLYQVLGTAITHGHNSMHPLKASILAGLSGVRGAVTMAGVLSIPTIIDGGARFPSRSLALFVAAFVIIISLLAATITLPLISKNKAPLITRGSNVDGVDDDEIDDTEPDDNSGHVTEEQARIYIMKLAINNVEEHRRADNQQAAFDLILDYQFLIRRLEIKENNLQDMNKIIADELALRRVALNGEFDALEELRSNNEISEEAYLSNLDQLQRADKRLRKSIGSRPKMHLNLRNQHRIQKIKRAVRMWFVYRNSSSGLGDELAKAHIEQAKAAIKALSEYFNRDDIENERFDSQSVYHLVIHYRNQIEEAKNRLTTKKDDMHSQIQSLRIKALAAEREGVQVLLEQGKIDWKMAAHLRQYINYSETVLIMDYQNRE